GPILPPTPSNTMSPESRFMASTTAGVGRLSNSSSCSSFSMRSGSEDSMFMPTIVHRGARTMNIRREYRMSTQRLGECRRQILTAGSVRRAPEADLARRQRQLLQGPQGRDDVGRRNVAPLGELVMQNRQLERFEGFLQVGGEGGEVFERPL